MFGRALQAWVAMRPTACPCVTGQRAVASVPYSAGSRRCRRPDLFTLGAGSLRGLALTTVGSRPCHFCAGRGSLSLALTTRGRDLPFCSGSGVSARVCPERPWGRDLPFCVGRGVSMRGRPSSTEGPRPARRALGPKPARRVCRDLPVGRWGRDLRVGCESCVLRAPREIGRAPDGLQGTVAPAPFNISTPPAPCRRQAATVAQLKGGGWLGGCPVR